MLEFLAQFGFNDASNPVSEFYQIRNGDFSMGVTYNAQTSRYRPTIYTIIFGDGKSTIRLNEDDITGIDWASVQNAIDCETDAEVKMTLVDVIIENGISGTEINFKTLAWRYRWLRTHEEMMVHSPDYRDNFNKAQLEGNVAQYLGNFFKKVWKQNE